MLKILFIVLGMFACSGIAIRLFKDLNRRDGILLPAVIWHSAEMVSLIIFLSFLL